MSKLLCDECSRKGCKDRVEGAVCSIKEASSELVKAYKTRDPALLALQFVGVIETEAKRYKDAVNAEGIGGDDEQKIYDGEGNLVKKIVSTKKLDPVITQMASNIIKNAKLLNDIVNPKKSVPLFQQNTQINMGNVVADDLRALEHDEKENVLKFIESKIDEENN